MTHTRSMIEILTINPKHDPHLDPIHESRHQQQLPLVTKPSPTTRNRKARIKTIDQDGDTNTVTPKLPATLKSNQNKMHPEKKKTGAYGFFFLFNVINDEEIDRSLGLTYNIRIIVYSSYAILVRPILWCRVTLVPLLGRPAPYN